MDALTECVLPGLLAAGVLLLLWARAALRWRAMDRAAASVSATRIAAHKMRMAAAASNDDARVLHILTTSGDPPDGIDTRGCA